jgi:ketosteroid isomerase-like protein
MNRDDVMQWVAAYEQAWRAEDLDAVAGLFTENAYYRRSPVEEPEIGHEAIRAFWLEDEGEPFAMTAEPVAVDGNRAVVRVEVSYGDPVRQEYVDLWVVRFAPGHEE